MTMQDGPSPPLPLELWSRDAGTFFCNEALYRTLHAVRSLRLRPASSVAPQAAKASSHGSQPPARLLPALFIHLPTLETADVATSAAFVRRAAELMVGVRPDGEDGDEGQSEGERLGADTDRHGCRPSARCVWCAATGRCQRPWEQPCGVVAGSLAAGDIGRRMQAPSPCLGTRSAWPSMLAPTRHA